MATNIYVGNISYRATEQDLVDLFSAYGEVASARIITDRDTGRSRGFGFVEMQDDAAAREAIEALNGAEHLGRRIVVNEARAREQRPRRPRW
ncbi:MAG: RNA-binding protein [Zetaproteobacteria bacterium]|nr:MAG: RNA-binding protein [Zetaproteobacteria bacterium]